MTLRVIGVGNAWRADDAVGLIVVRALRRRMPAEIDVLEREGEPTSLIDAWDGADAVWLVDAVSSGSTPGTVHRVDAGEQAVPAAFGRGSTHHFGLPEAIELARTLGRLPSKVVVYGIEGVDFEAGDALTPAVEAAVEDVADAILREVLAAAAPAREA